MTDVQSVAPPVAVAETETEFSASTRVTAGVVVLTLVGPLDRRALPALRRAVRAALKVRTARAVVDLEGALLGEDSAPVLRWIRSALARHGGSSFLLVTASHASLTWLHEAGHDDYRVLPTVPLAVGVAAGTMLRSVTVPRQLVIR
jgi:hypothetical protein